MVVTLAGRPQARSTQETLVQPRIPRAAALCLALAAVALGALTLAGSQEAAQWGTTWMQTLSPQASIALIGSAFGLVLLLSGWRRTGVLSAALGTGFAALEVLAVPLAPLGEFWATQASNSGSRTLGLTLFAASTATLLMGWQHAGASRWAGVELTTAFLVAVGAVGILSAGGAGGYV